jgi:hypothetical protein
MKNSAIKVFWTCPKCEAETELTVWPVIPAQIYGPPENCYPEEGGEYEPTECPNCNQPIESEDAHERAADKYQSDQEAWDRSERE